MERAVVMVHKLTDADVERLCCRQDFIKQEAAAENKTQGDGPSFWSHLEETYIKSEVPDAELEAITVRDEPIDWHQEPQASSSSGSHAVAFKREIENDCAEARSGRAGEEDKLREDSFDACKPNFVHQRPVGASPGRAGPLPSDVSGSGSGVEAAHPDRLVLRPLLCGHCDYSTGRSRRRRRSLMELHLRVRHKLGCYYKCELCDYSTMFIKNLRRHPASKHVKSQLFKCKFCDYSSVEKRSVKLHRASKHVKSQLFKCEFCDYFSAHRMRIIVHLTSKHGRGQLFKCEFCDYSSADKNCVKLHRASIHGKGKLYKCEFCDYVSARTNRVREHQAIKHGKGQLYRCEICDYSSARTGRLKEHLASKHGKGQLFKCELCDYYSAQKNNVKLHKARKHCSNNLFLF